MTNRAKKTLSIEEAKCTLSTIEGWDQLIVELQTTLVDVFCKGYCKSEDIERLVKEYLIAEEKD